MKTIEIGAQESAEALKSAFADALANAIGWTHDGAGNVKKSGVPLYFVFEVSGGNIVPQLSNGTTSIIPSYDKVGFTASKTYRLLVVQSAAGTIAVGVANSTENALFPLVLAQNTAGEYVGVNVGTSQLSVIHKNSSTDSIMSVVSTIKSTTICTAISIVPDVWGAAMFKDLYSVWSCPYTNSETVYTIVGKNYRMVMYNGTAGIALAIPEV